jgi:hypothetical protein
MAAGSHQTTISFDALVEAISTHQIRTISSAYSTS